MRIIGVLLFSILLKINLQAQADGRTISEYVELFTKITGVQGKFKIFVLGV